MAEDSFKIDIKDGIATLYLCNGITNALNPEVIARLSGAVQEVSNRPELGGLILTSANDKFFSIGLDIPHLYDISPREFASFYQQFNQACLELYTLPKPTVAAINGHAIAGGYILALCCDYRLVAGGRRLMGLNEIKLGVPVPYLADRILYETIGSYHARQVMETGEFYLPEAALQLGLVDEVCVLEDLLPRAIERVRAILAFPGGAYAEIKNNRTAPVVHQIWSKLAETDKTFVSYWYKPVVREKLKEAMDRF